MTAIADLIAEYKTLGLYKRELRPFQVTPTGPGAGRLVPDVDSLSAPRDFEVSGGRGWLDNNQSVFGYFYGGGWVFGLVENPDCRAELDGFGSYSNGDQNRVPFRVGVVSGPLNQTFDWAPPQSMPKPRANTHNRVIVLRNSFSAAIKLPPPSKLRTIDALAFAHDRTLRERDARGWADAAYRNSAAYNADFETANRALKQGLDLFLRDSWNPLRRSWRGAKGQLQLSDWEAFGSLIHYECALARFASWILGFADGDEGRTFKTVALQKTYLTETHVQYSPPLSALSERTRILERLPDGSKAMRGPGRDAVTGNLFMLERYEAIKADLIREFAQDRAE